MTDERQILDEQIAYYRERAGEYDQWFLREGRFDRGEEHRRQWFAEIAKVEQALAEAHPGGDILELACGTGLWTRHLVRWGATLTALDASPEALEINRGRLSVLGQREAELRSKAATVRFAQADLFAWEPQEQYDFIFFGFWLSHIPRERFEPFWRTVRSALRPGGQVFFVDSRFTQESTAKDHRAIDHSGVVERKLNDGRVWRIVKMFYEPQELQERLEQLGWRAVVRGTAEFFLYGQASG